MTDRLSVDTDEMEQARRAIADAAARLDVAGSGTASGGAIAGGRPPLPAGGGPDTGEAWRTAVIFAEHAAQARAMLQREAEMVQSAIAHAITIFADAG